MRRLSRRKDTPGLPAKLGLFVRELSPEIAVKLWAKPQECCEEAAGNGRFAVSAGPQ